MRSHMSKMVICICTQWIHHNQQAKFGDKQSPHLALDMLLGLWCKVSIECRIWHGEPISGYKYEDITRFSFTNKKVHKFLQQILRVKTRFKHGFVEDMQIKNYLLLFLFFLLSFFSSFSFTSQVHLIHRPSLGQTVHISDKGSDT